MSAWGFRRRSFSGLPLQGHKLVRLVHLDESGISESKDEGDYAVVAGTIIEPDAEYVDLEGFLTYLAQRYVPRDKIPSFQAFHATELFNGGDIFPRDEYPIERKLPIIRQLLSVPRRFNASIVYGIARKSHYANDRAARFKTAGEAAHAQAFMQALWRANRWMRDHARPNEVAMVVVEDNNEMREHLRFIHTWLQMSEIAPELMSEFPLERIVEGALFARKYESSILQVADMCAHLIKRCIDGRKHAEWLFDLIKRHIQVTPLIENDPLQPIMKRRSVYDLPGAYRWSYTNSLSERASAFVSA